MANIKENDIMEKENETLKFLQEEAEEIKKLLKIKRIKGDIVSYRNLLHNYKEVLAMIKEEEKVLPSIETTEKVIVNGKEVIDQKEKDKVIKEMKESQQKFESECKQIFDEMNKSLLIFNNNFSKWFELPVSLGFDKKFLE